MTLEHYIPVIEDLSRDMSTQARYQRLLQAIHLAIPCDAICLLRLNNNQLLPEAFVGLREEVRGRHFLIENHPRLQAILSKDELVRFDADCPLPDPYDGLLHVLEDKISVHDCMGVSIFIEGKPWGVITFDAARAGQFDEINPHQQALAITMTKAVITAVERIDRLFQQLTHGHELTAGLNRDLAKHEIIGNSKIMQQFLTDVDVVAATDLTVLVEGETGVGKELVAERLHIKSNRSQNPFIKLNCAALPDSLAEAELFGHTRGAFTGAIEARAGRFELADGGTLLLDEIGELPLPLQAKLLRVLQEGEVQRMGSDKTIKVDVRIIAATNRNLSKAVTEGRFRADLYHRLSVFPLKVPPLRERGNDILQLAEFFLERNQHRLNVNKLLLAEDARELLIKYSWPGNVRELEHLLSRAAVKASKKNSNNEKYLLLTAKQLPLIDVEPTEEISSNHSNISSLSLTDNRSLKELTKEFQKQLISEKLMANNQNIAATARELGVDRSNLSRLIKTLSIK